MFMGNSKVFLGLNNIKSIMLGRQGGKLFLGETKLYPLEKPIGDAVVSCDDATYNGSVQTAQNIVVTLSGVTLVAGTDYTVTSNTGGTNAGTYIVEVTGAGDYTGTTSGTFTINKVTPTVTAPTAKVLTYNGSQQELVNAGSTNFGTLQYRAGSDSWSTSIPTRQKGGSYVVQYKVVGDSNINDVAAENVQCSINEKQVTATVTLSQTAYTYNGSACQPTPTVKDGSTVIDPSEYSVAYSNNINVGTGTVTISDNVGGDYEVIGSATFTINKANSSLSFSVTNITVTLGEAKTNAVTVNAGDGTVTYTSNNTSVVTVNNSGIVTGIGVGNTTVSANISSTSNYNSATTSYNVTCRIIVTAKFNVTSTSSPTRIASGTTSFAAIEIDGVAQPSVSTGYTFDDVGEHTVKYYLKDTSIGDNAFYSCSGLTSCTIGSGVTSIDNDAFYHCSSLTSINIPNRVTTIGDFAFRECTSLTSCTIGSSVTSIGDNAFDSCSSLISIDIPDSVTSIGRFAFNNCSSLTSCTIGSGVTSIGTSAFSRCSGLTSITVNATTPPTLGGNAFYSTNNCPIYVPCDSVDTYKVASGWSSYASRIDCKREYVEIGGIKWATMNIGATGVTDTGLYFQWGDISGYTASQVGSGSGEKYFGWADYKYGNGTSSPSATGMTKYNSSDGKTVLESSDDAVQANWGGSWRMPTTAEFQALGNAVNTAWTESYQGSGVAGLVCTDKTNSSKVLFFPAAGSCLNGSMYNVGRIGHYWSSSLGSSDVQNAYYLYFRSSRASWGSNNNRYVGFSVRGVVG